jgi:hypothetical protein
LGALEDDDFNLSLIGFEDEELQAARTQSFIAGISSVAVLL